MTDMDGPVSSRTARTAIEERFGFLVDDYGYSLVQSSDLPATVWYRSHGRAVTVTYDLEREPPLDVTLQEGPDAMAFDLRRLLETRGLTSVAPPGPYDAATIGAELDRLKRLVLEECATFLRGDIESFHRAFREASLVEHCRELARDAYFEGNFKLAIELFQMLREYWDDRDREIYELALRRETPLTRVSKR